MAGPASGKTGKAYYDSGGGETEILDVTNWNLNKSSDNKPYASSTTDGHRKRVAGHKDKSGSFEFYVTDGDPGNIPIAEGDAVTLALDTDTGKRETGPAIIDDIEIPADIEGGDPVKITVNFSGNGEWT